MANKTINIEQIETNTIFVNSKLVVTIKNRTAFVLIVGGGCFYNFFDYIFTKSSIF